MEDWYLFIIENLIEGLDQMTWVEIIAFTFGVVSVWFEKQENILVFPTGLVNVTLTMYVCYHALLYGDMGINGYYFAMSFYGWYNWSRKKDDQKILVVSTNSTTENWQSVTLTAAVFLVLYFCLSNFTDTDVAFWDGLTTAFFITAMWLVTKKKIENWHYWIAGNLISIPLYFSKGLMLFSLQYLIFLGLAIAGLIAWKRKI